MALFRAFRLKRIDKKIRAAEDQLAWLRAQHCPFAQSGITTVEETIAKLVAQRKRLSA
jgi:hypothetical protein